MIYKCIKILLIISQISIIYSLYSQQKWDRKSKEKYFKADFLNHYKNAIDTNVLLRYIELTERYLLKMSNEGPLYKKAYDDMGNYHSIYLGKCKCNQKNDDIYFWGFYTIQTHSSNPKFITIHFQKEDSVFIRIFFNDDCEGKMDEMSYYRYRDRFLREFENGFNFYKNFFNECGSDDKYYEVFIKILDFLLK